jgi:peroxiredoxin Q/BCP
MILAGTILLAALGVFVALRSRPGLAPALGSLAPDFTLPCQDGSTVRLADLRGQWVVLYFYPKDKTPG